ncbi:MAG TPA: hypothetical protein VGY48_12510 [Vicinamibacterales bacterium]|jgi:hypothetical protein|nr:hypothetical protein [Vicinamibacterales bacterium]
MAAPTWLGVPSPALAGGSPLYVTGEDGLRLTVFNSAAGVTVTFSGRFLPAKQRDDEADQRVSSINQTLVPTTARAASTVFLSLGEGWLLDWSVQATAGTPLVGQTFATLEIVRGTSGALARLSRLGHGYLTATTALGWPGSTFTNSLDGEGAVRSIQVSTPAAGADFLQAVPTGARWELLSVKALLTTAVAVANRSPRLLLDDGANVLFDGPAPVTQAASLAVVWSWGAGAGGPVIADAGAVSSPIPNDVYLSAGFRILSSTGLLQAADQWSAINLLVREWIEA